MAVDMSKQAYEAIQQVIRKILGDRDEAAAYAEDPKGYLASEGVADYDLSSVNMQQVVQQTALGGDMPAATKQAVQQSYAGGDGGYQAPPTAPAAGQAPADHLVQHINHVTHITYEGDDYITQQLINQENYDYSSYTNVNMEGKFYGDVAVDASTVTATDGGIASTGSGDVVGATGDGAVAAGRDAEGVATGDGAVAAGRDINAPVNTGEFTGAQAGGDIGTSVVGDNNTTLSDISGSNVNLGGEQTNVQDSHLHQSAIGGNVQTSEVNIEASDGGAVAFGAGSKAEGSQDDTYVNAQNSNVQTGDGVATQHLDQSHEHTEIDKSINDSFNQDLDASINDSFNEETHDNSTNIDVAIGGAGGDRMAAYADETPGM
jgi:hypothetical protein